MFTYIKFPTGVKRVSCHVHASHSYTLTIDKFNVVWCHETKKRWYALAEAPSLEMAQRYIEWFGSKDRKITIVDCPWEKENKDD